jgi:hypothetical protein
LSVLDKRKRSLMPCSEKRARLLLTRGRAVVHRRYPFTIRLKHRIGAEVQPVRVKLDPGSNTTDIAVVTDKDGNKPAKVLCPFELSRRGRHISEALMARRPFRRRRRGANLRYRALRFANRTHAKRWLAPSLQHRLIRARPGSSGCAASRRFRRYLWSAFEVRTLVGWQIPTLAIKATGRGSYRRTKLTAHGFPCGHCMRARSLDGFNTGDMERADLSKGKRTLAVSPFVQAGLSTCRRRRTSCGALMPGTAQSAIVPTDINISDKGRRFLCRLLPAVSAPISDVNSE